MKIITLCSIGFLKILFRGNSAVEMYLNICFYILHLLTSSLLNGLKAIRCYALQIQRKTIPQHIWITFCFLLTTTAWSNVFTYLSYCSYLKLFWERKSLEYLRLDRPIQNLIQAERYCRSVVLILRSLVVELNSFPLTNPDNAKTLNHDGVTKLLPHWLPLCFLYF